MTASSVDEADYLCAVLNAPTTTEQVRPLMSYGKDERDIAKHVWELPIPRFDANDRVHARLSFLGAELERLTLGSALRQSHFTAVRRDLRAIIDHTSKGREVDELVFEMLG